MPFECAAPVSYLITDGTATTANFAEKSAQLLDLIKIAVENDISLVQIREKLLTAREIFALTEKAVGLTKNSATKLLVNDRADIALAANADGVHLTANSLTAGIIRENFPPAFIIGVSAHHETEIEMAIAGNADFATFSPIFPTLSKISYGAPQGVEKLRAMSEKYAPFPLLALGGIDQSNFEQCLKAGAKGIAGISLFVNAEDVISIAPAIRDFHKFTGEK